MSLKFAAGIFLCYFLGFAQAVEIKCPPESEIAPAKCTIKRQYYDYDFNPTAYSYLYFDSRIESREKVEQVFASVRRANKLRPEDCLTVDGITFASMGDYIPSIDLTTLGKTRTFYLSITGNFPEITSDSSDTSVQLVDVNTLLIRDSPNFTTDQLTLTLNYLVTSNLKAMEVSNSSLSAFPDNMPRLSSLEKVVLKDCNVSKIASLQFQRNVNLKEVVLNRCGLREIEENAFDSERNGKKTGFFLWLANNPIEEKGVSAGHGLSKIPGKVVLKLENTRITSLTSSKWREFLYAATDKEIQFTNNPLFCSPAMRWIKDDRRRLQSQVKDPACGNDKGKTVFNSNLV